MKWAVAPTVAEKKEKINTFQFFCQCEASQSDCAMERKVFVLDERPTSKS